MKLTPSVTAYEQLAAELRHQIMAGEFNGKLFPSGPALAKEIGTSQHTVQQAFGILTREGLIAAIPGRGTIALPRSTWYAQFKLADAASVTALEEAVEQHPGVHKMMTEGLAVSVKIESANWGGATVIAESLGSSLPVEFFSLEKDAWRS